MKTKILELLKERKEINLTDMISLMPEIKGDYDVYLPVKKGYNEKILLISCVSKEFIITLFSNLIELEKKVNIKERNIMLYMFDGSPIYELQVFTKKLAKKQVECWMPMVISLA